MTVREVRQVTVREVRQVNSAYLARNEEQHDELLAQDAQRTLRTVIHDSCGIGLKTITITHLTQNLHTKEKLYSKL